ncbi:TspO and MBR related proteins [Peptoclostridium litorale DSM 5388]|uniref:TspO/MBR-like protein n=1 Tax=Peptoclostridium litorale DSM 5388 TaxID=1121324 RepID=A0A069RI80_PEPLI|nr:TspO/MBR family protein [Peptoclostridium litorale]KDR96739.1 TspO/MBR-like protein [Peptoclostridium litorale DSM 5388]SIN67283.1 TspO and MBR related proteins [Peptoclostridium litorale DSM 5388]
MKNIKDMLVAIAIPEAVGMLSALLTADTMMVYMDLRRPSFSPPGWMFGPVWTLLYALMGYASFRIWVKRKEDSNASSALGVYSLQLFLNFIWTILFFRMQLRGVAFVDIILLLAFIVLTTVKFFNIDRFAGYIMIPYIMWVSFASVLNYAFWSINR